MAKTKVTREYIDAVTAYMNTLSQDIANINNPNYKNPNIRLFKNKAYDYFRRLCEILRGKKLSILDRNLPNIMYQTDLRCYLLIAPPEVFKYIIAHYNNFQPIIVNPNTGIEALVDGYESYWPLLMYRLVPRNILANTILAIKCEIPISPTLIYEVIYTTTLYGGYKTPRPDYDSINMAIMDVATFKYLINSYLTVIPDLNVFEPSLYLYIAHCQYKFLEIILPKYTKPLNIEDHRLKIIQAINAQIPTKHIITLLLVLEKYGMRILDGPKDDLYQLLLSTPDFEPYLNNDHNVLIQYYPPSIKSLIYEIELIRNTPGNVIHLLPNEIAYIIYQFI